MPAVQSRRTPLQNQYAALRYNIDFLTEMKEIKKALHGLSPETREAWKTFVDLAWRDIGFQKSQVEMYADATKEDRKGVQNLNLWVKKQKVEDESKKFQARNLYKCTKCYDNGSTDTIMLKGEERKLYCTCELGQELYKSSPEAKLKGTNDARAEEIKQLAGRVRHFTKVLLEKHYADGGSNHWEDIHVCRYCNLGFSRNRAWGEKVEEFRHTNNCDMMPEDAVYAWKQLQILKDELKTLRKKPK